MFVQILNNSFTSFKLVWCTDCCQECSICCQMDIYLTPLTWGLLFGSCRISLSMLKKLYIVLLISAFLQTSYHSIELCHEPLRLASANIWHNPSQIYSTGIAVPVGYVQWGGSSHRWLLKIRQHLLLYIALTLVVIRIVPIVDFLISACYMYAQGVEQVSPVSCTTAPLWADLHTPWIMSTTHLLCYLWELL